MKKIIKLVVLAACLSIAVPATAHRSMAIKSDVTGLLAGTSIDFAVGFSVGDKITLYVPVMLGAFTPNFAGGVGFGFTYNLTGSALHDGWVIGADIGALYAMGQHKHSKHGILPQGVSAEGAVGVGYDWVWKNGLSLGMAFEAEASYISGKFGVTPAASLELGYVW